MSRLPVLLLIDNYDSFTHNLAQCFMVLGQDVRVVRNDRISLREADQLRPERVVISPGPGDPTGAGVCVDMIRHLAGRVPVLGVCLGHQCIAYAHGGEIVRAARVMHGKTSPVAHDGTGLHAGLPQDFPATRYHSLAVREDTLPSGFRVTARAEDDGTIMAIAHEERMQFGVQYHPESYLTGSGMHILDNFLEVTSC